MISNCTLFMWQVSHSDRFRCNKINSKLSRIKNNPKKQSYQATFLIHPPPEFLFISCPFFLLLILHVPALFQCKHHNLIACFLLAILLIWSNWTWDFSCFLLHYVYILQVQHHQWKRFGSRNNIENVNPYNHKMTGPVLLASLALFGKDNHGCDT